MIPKLFPVLLASPPVTALLGLNPLRVFPWGEAPQNVAYPYATYGVFNGVPENYMDQVPDLDRLGTQVDVWAKTSESCQQSAVAIRNALEPIGHMTSISNMERDPQTKSYRLRLEFDFYTTR
ncbi:DUF3168 domain-containing protein [Larkinella harenae]